MNQKTNFECISGSWLKIFAVFAMTIDHIAGRFIRGTSLDVTILTIANHSISLYNLSRSIGRMAFVIFGFLLVEGFIHTHSKYKYGRNLLLFAIISEIPWDLSHGGSLFYYRQNVLFTLFLVFLDYALLSI